MSEKMKSINIKGKNYVQVNERVKAFRSSEEFAGWSIQTAVEQLTDEVCVMRCIISDADGLVKATGWAREVRNDAASMVNKTSYVENCETSAVGRALGFLGIGIDDNICSAEELRLALQQQEVEKRKEDEAAEDYTAILADIDAAQNMAQLKATMDSERVQKSPYLAAIRRVANNKAIKQGWVNGKD